MSPSFSWIVNVLLLIFLVCGAMMTEEEGEESLSGIHVGSTDAVKEDHNRGDEKESTVTESSINEEDMLWKSGLMFGIYDWLECEEKHFREDDPNAYPVHNLSTWTLMRNAYRETVGLQASS
jgi:hypothetical protein